MNKSPYQVVYKSLVTNSGSTSIPLVLMYSLFSSTPNERSPSSTFYLYLCIYSLKTSYDVTLFPITVDHFVSFCLGPTIQPPPPQVPGPLNVKNSFHHFRLKGPLHCKLVSEFLYFFTRCTYRPPSCKVVSLILVSSLVPRQHCLPTKFYGTVPLRPTSFLSTSSPLEPTQKVTGSESVKDNKDTDLTDPRREPIFPI